MPASSKTTTVALKSSTGPPPRRRSPSMRPPCSTAPPRGRGRTTFPSRPCPHDAPLRLGPRGSYGYWALFLIAVAEGPIITVIAGFLASRGLLDVALVFAVAFLADLRRDLLLYAIGRSGRAPAGLLRPGPAASRRIAELRRASAPSPAAPCSSAS